MASSSAPRTVPTGTPATVVAGVSSSYPTSSILGEPSPGAGSSALGAVSSPRAGSSGAGSSRPGGSGSVSRSGGVSGSSPASADASMGALTTLREWWLLAVH